MIPERVICITNPESPRTVAFAGAMLEYCGRLPEMVSWRNFLKEFSLPLSHDDERCLIRVESPGRNWEVEKQLLTLGAEITEELDSASTHWRRLGADVCETLVEDRGRIHPSRQWYLGFRRALMAMKHAGRARWFLPPEDIAVMFDKAACQNLLGERGCPIPQQLGIPAGFDDLMARMDTSGQQRVFLKLCHGSSASGAVALERAGPRIQAFSTTEMVHGANDALILYNSRKLQRYHSLSDLRTLIDAICRKRATAESWIPKAGWMEKRFDVRVVVIGGKARHVVARLADGPFTNLQFGARRGNAKDLRAFVGVMAFDLLLTAAEQAMACFPNSLHGAVDIALEVGMRRAYVLEINAFGDLLPNLLCEGRDTYAWELEEAAKGQPAGILSSRPPP